MADFQDKTRHILMFDYLDILKQGLSSNYILDLNFDNITSLDIIDVHFEK